MFIGCNCREELSLNELQSSGYELPYPTTPRGGGVFSFSSSMALSNRESIIIGVSQKVNDFLGFFRCQKRAFFPQEAIEKEKEKKRGKKGKKKKEKEEKKEKKEKKKNSPKKATAVGHE